jgi:hypothetical protein
MKFLPLLGKRLKDDEVMDILETYDIEVIYDFDRLHENMPDAYWAHFKEQGFLLNFNADQELSTVFLYLENLEGFTPIEIDQLEDIQVFRDVEEVRSHAAVHGFVLHEGGQREGESAKSWARFDSSTTAIHYEFAGRKLTRITIMVLAA